MVTKSAAIPHLLSIVVAVAVGGWASAALAQDEAKAEQKSAEWTLEEAMGQLRIYPNDAYLQYVAMQLAHREGTAAETGEDIGRITGATRPAWRNRNEGVNLFSLFSGSLAVQESLQLETMTGEVLDPRQGRGSASRRSPSALVPISELQGPTIQSHPWTEMLAGRQPEFSSLAACVPEDQYYVRFESVARLLEVLDLSDLWGAHLFSQTSRQAHTSMATERLLAQLALETSDLLRPLYDTVVQKYLLPFLGEQELYAEFRLDQPWDSPHNKALVNRLPRVYDSPGRQNRDPGTTTYVAIVGENLLFDGEKTGVKMADITDGLSNTVMLVDANDAEGVIWTKPEDIPFDPETLRNAIMGRVGIDSTDGLVVMADGSVKVLKPEVEDDTLHHALTRNGGEALGEFGERAPFAQPRRGFFSRLSGLGLDDMDERIAYEFITRGLGDRIGLHVYDGEPAFDFQLTQFLGQTLGSFAGSRRLNDNFIPAFLLIASLNSPVYVSLLLEDADITDTFLTHLDTLVAPLARRNVETGFFRLERDFYTLPIAENVAARSLGISFGPIKWRFFWARIGNNLYVATQPEVLQDLTRLSAPHATSPASPGADAGPAAHAMVRIRPEHWKQMLPNFHHGSVRSEPMEAPRTYCSMSLPE